jgi:hypothetical protein
VQLSPSRRRAIGACAVIVWTAGIVARASVQDPAAAAAPKPASAGVYSADQAGRGRELFGAICEGCHNIASQSGEAFAKRWRGVLVSDLFQFMTNTMPKDDPGSLTPKERVDVIAYLLKINDLAAGTEELPPDVERLKLIVIDLPDGHQPRNATSNR